MPPISSFRKKYKRTTIGQPNHSSNEVRSFSSALIASVFAIALPIPPVLGFGSWKLMRMEKQMDTLGVKYADKQFSEALKQIAKANVETSETTKNYLKNSAAKNIRNGFDELMKVVDRSAARSERINLEIDAAVSKGHTRKERALRARQRKDFKENVAKIEALEKKHPDILAAALEERKPHGS